MLMTLRDLKWTEQPLQYYKYVDDFIGVEKVFTGSGIYSFSEKKDKD